MEGMFTAFLDTCLYMYMHIHTYVHVSSMCVYVHLLEVA